MKKVLLILIAVITFFAIGCTNIPDIDIPTAKVFVEETITPEGLIISFNGNYVFIKDNNKLTKTYQLEYNLAINTIDEIEIIETYRNEGKFFKVKNKDQGYGHIYGLTELIWDKTCDIIVDNNNAYLTISIKKDNKTICKMGPFPLYGNYSCSNFILKEVKTLN